MAEITFMILLLCNLWVIINHMGRNSLFHATNIINEKLYLILFEVISVTNLNKLSDSI